jgi:hypothetical protein
MKGLPYSAVYQMVKAVKLTLAMLFSLALLLTQGVAASGLGASARCTAQKKCCCGRNMSCCKMKAASDSPESPASPVPGGLSTQLQAALMPAALVSFLASQVSGRPSFSFLPALRCAQVSLYQRNCAYLI